MKSLHPQTSSASLAEEKLDITALRPLISDNQLRLNKEFLHSLRGIMLVIQSMELVPFPYRYFEPMRQQNIATRYLPTLNSTVTIKLCAGPNSCLYWPKIILKIGQWSARLTTGNFQSRAVDAC
jgi:hypothetical protein